MEYTWNRAFDEGREEALMGEGPERMLNAARGLSFDDGNCAVGVEAPLLGKAGYDVLVILQGDCFYPGCRLRDRTQIQAQAVVDWVTGLEAAEPDMFFEFDASGSDKLAGAYCKIEGRLELAEGFFNALGEPQKTEPFVRTAGRLPEGWLCLYAAAFPGRKSDITRMEIMIFSEEARRRASDEHYLRECFQHLGFREYDDSMLHDAARLITVGAAITMQFDLAEDGSFLPGFSVISNYEHSRYDFRALFAPDGELARTLKVYEDMGIADERWHLIEKSCFAVKRTLLTADGIVNRVNRCLPCCTKVKWKGAALSAAKFYLMMDSQRVD